MDLRSPHSTGKSRNTRFVNRVFTPDEQKLIYEASSPDALLWVLWAGKETAYKVISKNNPSASSVPKLYTVSLDSAEYSALSGDTSVENYTVAGFVHTPYGKVYIKIFITCDYVHCVGASVPLETTDAVVWHVDRIGPLCEASPVNESLCVREALKKHLSAYIDERPEDIEIYRKRGSHGLEPPFVYLHGKRDDIDISLSHDGMFTAYAFTLSEDSRTYAPKDSRGTSTQPS